MSDDQRLEALETRLAFQDQELQTLNEVLIDQQRQIDQLRGQLKILQDKIKDFKPEVVRPASEETPPPHY